MKKVFLILTIAANILELSAQPYTLEQCREMALENNAEIKNSRLDYDIADQTVKQAFTAYFPSVSATGLMFRSDDGMIQTELDMSSVAGILQKMGMNPAELGIPNPLPINMLDKGTVGMLTAVQPVFAGGQIVNSNRLSKIGRDVAELQMSLTGNEVVRLTEQYYWQIVALKEKLNTIATVENLLEEIHKNVAVAVDAGLAMHNDLLRVELQQQNIESGRVQIENGLTVLKLLLRQYTGATDSDFDISFSKFPSVENPMRYYVSTDEGVDRRNEKMLLDKSIDAARLQTKLEVGKNLPTIGIGAGYTYLDMMDKQSDFGMVFGAVTVPISSWWGGSHTIRGMRLKEQQAENTRNENIELLKVDIESKWHDLNLAYLQVGIAEKSIASATENLRLTKNYYDAGTIAMNDLLDAQNLFQQSRDQFSDANADYRQKLTAYLQATGR